VQVFGTCGRTASGGPAVVNLRAQFYWAALAPEPDGSWSSALDCDTTEGADAYDTGTKSEYVFQSTDFISGARTPGDFTQEMSLHGKLVHVIAHLYEPVRNEYVPGQTFGGSVDVVDDGPYAGHVCVARFWVDETPPLSGSILCPEPLPGGGIASSTLGGGRALLESDETSDQGDTLGGRSDDLEDLHDPLEDLADVDSFGRHRHEPSKDGDENKRRLFNSALALVLPYRPAPTVNGRSDCRTPSRTVVMQEPGTEVDLEAIGWEERTWAKRVNADTTDDGACFIVPEDEAPDPSLQWFFCSSPSEDDTMQCELVPEWMGSAPDGGHEVWMCSKAPPS